MMNPNINNMMILNKKSQNDKEVILDIVDQNNQLANQIAMNNSMIKNMIENQNFGNNKQSNEFFKKFWEIDFFPGMDGERINIIFEDPRGTKLNMITPLDVKMKELFQLFHIKLQIYGKFANIKVFKFNEYYFLYSGYKVPINEQKSVREYGLHNTHERITFNRINELIGG